MAFPKLETPTFDLTLPSNGKKIKFRPFLVKEHKVLLTLSGADDDNVISIIKDLISVCTFNQLNVDELPHFDIEYVFMMLRAKSIGENVDVVITCTNCETKYDSSFNIEDIKVEKPKNVNDKILLTDKIGLQLRYPNFKSVAKIFQSDDVEEIFKLVKSCLKGVFDDTNFYDVKEQTDKEVDEFLESLTKEQFDKIEQFFVNSPKVVQVIETDCPNCNHHNISRVEGLQNFFL
jgi:hypothetical protein